jgi:hypothetical protein
MRLPLIKSLVDFIDENDVDYLIETEDVLSALAMSKGIKDNEIEVIAEIMSNMSGAIEVHKKIKSGSNKKDALNDFMQRVLGSIDKK